jgi:hypothetical protein
MTLRMVVPPNIKSKGSGIDGASGMLQEHQPKQKLQSSSSSSVPPNYDSSSDYGENPADCCDHHDGEEEEAGGDHEYTKKGGTGELVTRPGVHDVLLGRGGGTNNHVGNVNFRKLVNEHKMRYLSCSKVEKPRVARVVVKIWKKLDPPGRFLQKVKTGEEPTAATPSSMESGNGRDDIQTATWVEVSEKKAQEKASQCLRERTADVIPYLSQLQQHRDQLREQGVSMISQRIASGGADVAASMPSLGAGGMVGNDFSLARSGMDGMPNHQMVMLSSPSAAASGMMDGNLRRGSMPAGRSPGTPGTPNSIPSRAMSAAARRTSMPAMGCHLPSHHQATMPMHRQGMATPQRRHQFGMENRVLQEAYTAIEQSGGVDPRSMMLMEQMMQEQEMMERRAMMRERHAVMMQQQQGQLQQQLQQEQQLQQQQMMHTPGMSQGMLPMPLGMSSGISPRMGLGGSFMMNNMIGMGDMTSMNGMNCMGNVGAVGGVGSGAMGGDMMHRFPPSAAQQHQEMMMQAHQQRMYHESMKETLIDQHRFDVLQRQEEEMMLFKQHAAMKRQGTNPIMAATPNNVESSERLFPHDGDDGEQKLGQPKRQSRMSPPPVINLTEINTAPLMHNDDDESDDEPIPLSRLPDVAISSPISGRKGGKHSPKQSFRDKKPGSRALPSMSAQKEAEPLTSSTKTGPPPCPATPARKRDDRKDDQFDALSPIHTHLKSNSDHHDEFTKGYDEEEITVPLKGASLPSPSRQLKPAIKPSFPPRGTATYTAGSAAAAGVGSGANDGAGGTSSEAALKQYRKALEDYMSNHQIAPPSGVGVDIDDDISDEEGDVGRVDASAWIQQALNDSDEITLNHTERKRTKRDHRGHRHHRDHPADGRGDHHASHQNELQSPRRGSHKIDDVMSTDGKSVDGRSMDGMSLMSLAVSELEQIERNNAHVGAAAAADDSDMEEESVDFGGRTRRISGAARSMASNQSVMSELTDFSDNDDEDDDNHVGDW